MLNPLVVRQSNALRRKIAFQEAKVDISTYGSQRAGTWIVGIASAVTGDEPISRMNATVPRETKQSPSLLLTGTPK